MAWGDVFANTAPNYATVSHPVTPDSILDAIAAPLPTNSSFNNLFLGTTKNRIVTIPYQLQAQDNGLYICYPVYNNISGNITSAFLKNVTLEATETFATKKITALDKGFKLSATEKWSVDASHYMEAYLVKGMPYVTMNYHDVTPIIKTQHAISSVNGGSSPGAVTATKFKVVLNNGQTWIFYASSSIELTWSNTGGWQMLASAAFTGTIRAVYLGASGDETKYDTYKTAYPISCDVDVAFAGDIATMTYTFTMGGTGDLLMLALPHHMDMFPEAPTTETLTLTSLKGVPTGIVGTTWTLQEQLTTIGWDAPREPSDAKRTAIISALTSETITAPNITDPYGQGKALARLGRLAVMADHFSLTSLATSIRTNMKTGINDWLNHINTDALKYDEDWGGICSTNGLADSGADYGQGYYNDHHFHYGYFAYAAAAIAKTDSTWKTSFNDKVLDLIRDYSNPSDDDDYFVKFRNKDFYDFHSWSNGITQSGDVNNQESSSEAINAYYGTYMWGLATGNDYIKNVGRLLLAMEIRAVKKYYHIRAVDTIYGSPFNANKIVGILWASKVDYSTFFGANVEYIHGIQMLPILPVTELSLTPEWVAEEYPIVATALTRPSPVLSDEWEGFIVADHAVIDREAAWDEAQLLTAYDGGNSKSNLLYWIATRPGDDPVTPVINPSRHPTDFYSLADNAKATVAAGALNNLTDPITVAVVSGGSKFPDTNTQNPFYVTVYDAVNYPDPGDDPNMEKMLCTARSGNSFTLTRGQLGTSAAVHPGSPTMRLLSLTKHFDMIHTAINALEAKTSLDGFPTVFAFNNGVLQKKDPGSDTWEDFEVRGINYTPTPIGFNPDGGRIWDPFCNVQQAKWFCENFKAINGNTARIYWPGSGQITTFSPAAVSGLLNSTQLMRTLDVFYQYGIYVLIDVFVRFYPAYDTPEKLAWYKNLVAQHFVEMVGLTQNHPAIMGYVFGNETNLYKETASVTPPYQNLGGLLTINQWWDFANKVAYEGKQMDENHIMGISSGLSDPTAIADAIAAEESGQLNNYDFHGVNIYRGDNWEQPSNGDNFWDQWDPANEKPVIILETGQDSYDTDIGGQNEAAQADNVENLWSSFDRDKCPGICFFAAFDEQWKLGEDGGTTGNNAGTYGSSYYDGDNDGFHILPDEKGNEQHFGWWRYLTSLPYAEPPAAKQVVERMAVVWEA